MAAARVLRRFVRLVRSWPAVLAALLLALGWPIPTAAQDEDMPMKAPAGSELLRFGLQSLGARPPQPVDPRAGR
jgi:hypothetical protein